MFCKKCGNKMEHDAGFCQSCGTSKSAAHQASEPPGVQNREQDILTLNECLGHFSKIGNEYERNIYFNTKKHNLQEPKARTLIIIGAVLAGLPASVYILYGNFSIRLWAPIFFVVAVLVAIWTLRTRLHSKNVKYIDGQINDSWESIEKHYAKYENCPVGIMHSNPVVIREIINLIDGRRADCIKDAINIWVDDNHKAEMMHLQHQTAEFAKQTAASSREAAHQAGRAAKSIWR